MMSSSLFPPYTFSQCEVYPTICLLLSLIMSGLRCQGMYISIMPEPLLCRWFWLEFEWSQQLELFCSLLIKLGTGDSTKTDEFSEKFQRERGNFHSKNLYWRFWTHIQGFSEKKFLNDVSTMRGGGGRGRLEFFRKFIWRVPSPPSRKLTSLLASRRPSNVEDKTFQL